ncbi:hypothetical protein [Streptomyces sp. NRRL B-24484]|uniref:hypothetical protein n=1 Tax=Streptomyces sp. NRRL B-24484 TaxID=1463833 RepID=UPI0004BF44E6|nr:hypothetical protein [Streptomyces sp. NRRL B-24484]
MSTDETDNVIPLHRPDQEAGPLRWISLRGRLPLPTRRFLSKVRVPNGTYAVGTTGLGVWLYTGHHIGPHQVWPAVAVSAIATFWDAARLHQSTKLRIHRETLAHRSPAAPAAPAGRRDRAA